MQLHQLQRHTKRVKSRRVGRGGKRGKTSGRGMKGQKARAGHSIRPEVRDTIKKIPKLRGHGKNRARTVVVRERAHVVNVSDLEQHMKAGEQVTPRALSKLGLVRVKKGGIKDVKILGDGQLTKKLTISNCAVSKVARKKIEEVGGTIR